MQNHEYNSTGSIINYFLGNYRVALLLIEYNFSHNFYNALHSTHIADSRDNNYGTGVFCLYEDVQRHKSICP